MLPWLDAFGETRCVMLACHAVGMSRSAVYEARDTDRLFGEAWEALTLVHNEQLRSSIANKAIDGWDEPVFHEGRVCGYRRRFSVDLMKWFARLRLPEYRQLEEGASKGDADETARQVRSLLEAMLGTVAAPPPAAAPTVVDVKATVRPAKGRKKKEPASE